MLGLIVASHGDLAQELIKSSYLILGRQEKVIAVTFEPAEDLATLEDKYETSLQQFATTDRVLFLCDLYGGNPLLATRRFVKRDPKRLRQLAESIWRCFWKLAPCGLKRSV